MDLSTRLSFRLGLGGSIVVALTSVFLVFAATGAGDGENQATAPVAPDASFLPPDHALASPEPYGDEQGAQSHADPISGNISASQAAASINRSFSSEIDDLDSDPARLLTGSTVEKVFPGGARIVTPDGSHQLVESSTPLTSTVGSGQEDPLDLTLNRQGSSLEPANPLISTTLPESADDGVSIGRQVIITPDSSAATTDAVVTNRTDAVYANAGRDTDLMAAPISGGVELMEQLRSSASPNTFNYEIHMPAGTTLDQTDDQAIALRDGDHDIGQITAPWAVDAGGHSIPLSLRTTKSGFSVSTSIDHSTVYPVLVDPEVEVWGTANSTVGSWFEGDHLDGLDSWSWTTNDPAKILTGSGYGCLSSYSCWGSTPQEGLYVYFKSGTSFPANDTGQYIFDPYGATTFMTSAHLGPMFTNTHGTDPSCAQFLPYQFAGLYDPSTSTYAPNDSPYTGTSLWSTTSWALPRYQDLSQANDSAYRQLRVGMDALTATTLPATCSRDFYVGGATVTLDDPESPAVSAAATSFDPWVNDSPVRVNASATDPGVGVLSFTVEAPNNSGTTSTWWTSHLGSIPGWDCTGLEENPCPASWNLADEQDGLSYDPSTMPEGQQFLKVRAWDALFHSSGQVTVPVRVDHSPPVMVLTGSLENRDGKDIGTMSHNLQLDITDGNAVADGSGVKTVTITVDGQQVYSSGDLSCDTDNCGYRGSYDLNPADFAVGPHHVVVTAQDEVGNSTSQAIDISIDPTDPCADVGVEYYPDPPGCSPDTPDNVYLGQEWTANPANGGTLISTDIVQPSSARSLTITASGESTRGLIFCPAGLCSQVRTADWVGGDTTHASLYDVETGDTWMDPDLSIPSDFLEPSEDDPPAPEAAGPLSGVIASWQTLPANHGTGAIDYVSLDTEDGGDQVLDEWYADGNTKLPLRHVVTDTSEPDEPIVLDRYFTYLGSEQASAVDPNIFLLPPPTTIDSLEANSTDEADDDQTASEIPFD